MGKLTISTGPCSVANCKRHYQRLLSSGSSLMSKNIQMDLQRTSIEMSIYWLVGKLDNSIRSSKQLPVVHREYIEDMDTPNAPFIAPSVHHWIVIPNEKY